MKELSSIINSPGLWIASACMVIVVIAQSIVFLRKALGHAEEVGLSQEQVKSGMRSAIITSIGPSFAPVIVLVSLVAILGAPTSWMRMCDIGAGRTELGMATIAVQSIGAELTAEGMSVKAFGAAIWGMALNNLGWILITLLFTHNMQKALDKMNTTFNPKWIKLLTLGATMGLFGYLTANQIVGKASPNLLAVASSGIAIVLFNKAFGQKKGVREWAMGFSMIVGMVCATVYAGMLA